MTFKTPMLTVDALIVKDNMIVLIERLNPPFQGFWALPGGFVDVFETVESACVREAKEETSLDVRLNVLLGVYSDPKRDPRGHTVSAAYVCEIVGGELKAADDAKTAKWFSLDDLPKLAFDHQKIVEDYINTI